MDNAAEAKTRFLAGQSVGEVAKALGISWYKAKKLKPDGTPAATPATRAQVVAEEEAPEGYEVTITVPTARFDELFATLTDVEKATAIQYILQCRMDELLGGTT